MPHYRDGWLVSDAYAVPNLPLLALLASSYHRALRGEAYHDPQLLTARVNRVLALSEPLSEDEALNLLMSISPDFATEARP